MGNKKIIFIMRNINLLGGIETVTTNYANALSNYGYAVDIINLFSENDEQKFFLNKKINNLFLNYNNTGGNLVSKVKNFLMTGWKLKNFLKKKYKDENVCFIVTNPVYGLYIPRKLRKKTIVQLHASVDYIKNSFKFTALLLRLSKNQFKKIIFLTKANMDKAIEYKLASNKKATFIYNFINSKKDFDLINKQNRIVMLTRFSKEKNIDIAINCFAKVSEFYPQWTLEIYGDGPDKEKCQYIVNKINFKGDINLYNSTNDIDSVLKDASIYINTSDAEGFSMAMLESLSFGLNVIMFDNTIGLREIIDNEENGFIIEHHNTILLEETLKKVMSDKKNRKKVSTNAVKKSLLFSEENSILKLISVIEYKE